MPTVRDVINRAHRLLTGDLAVPQAEVAAAALEAFQNKMVGLVAAGAFGRLTDRLQATDTTACENHRYRIPTGVTITLPTEIEDYDCDTGYRPVRDKAVVVVVNSDTGVSTTSLYDANTGGWATLEALTLNDLCPLASRHMLDLAAIVAVEWAPEIIDPKPAAVARAQEGIMNLTRNWDSARRAAEGEYF